MLNSLKNKVYKTLRGSEGFFKTDMVYLAKGGFWLTSNRIVSAVITLALSIAFANLLAAEEYGAYKYVLSVAGLLGALSLTWLDTIVTQETAKGEDGIFEQAVRKSLRWGIIPFAVGLITSAYYLIKGDNFLSLSLIAIALYVPIISSVNLYGAFLVGKKNFRLLSILATTVTLATSIALFLVLLISPGRYALMFTYFLVNLVVVFLIYKYVAHKYRNSANLSPEAKEKLDSAPRISAFNSLSIASEHLDKILLFHFLGGAALAIYTFAIAPVNQVISLVKIVNPLATPKVAARPAAELKKTLPIKMLKLLLVSAVILTSYLFVAPYVYPLVFPQYLESIRYSQVFAIVLLFQPRKLMSISIIVKSDAKTLSKLSVISPSIRIISILIFVPIFGIWGAVFAQLTTYTIDTLISGFLFKRLK